MYSYRASHYSELSIDKAAHLRKEHDTLERLKLNESSIFVPFHNDQFLFQGKGKNSGSQLEAFSFTKQQLDDFQISVGQEYIFLGLENNKMESDDSANNGSQNDPQGTAYFAIDITSSQQAQAITEQYECQWGKLNVLAKDLHQEQASLLAYAYGLMHWNKQNLFKGTDGQETIPQEGGHARKSKSDTKSTIYPRIDPAVIVLVRQGEYALLGQKQGRAKNKFSIVAGFVEIGETFEQAVVREVDEETGVDANISTCSYLYSQPWPFPQSLMIGFIAESKTQLQKKPIQETLSSKGYERFKELQNEFKLDQNELEETLVEGPAKPNPKDAEMANVIWAHKEWLRYAIPEGPNNFGIPSTNSIAGNIIRQFSQNELDKFSQISNVQNEQTLQESLSKENKRNNSEWVKKFPEMEIDTGRFKYVLVRLYDSKTALGKIIVRGYKGPQFAYHQDVLQSTESQAQKVGLKVQVLGGGRIEHDVEKETLLVFGYSQAYGVAIHEVTVSLLKKWFPLYPIQNIKHSYEGY